MNVVPFPGDDDTARGPVAPGNDDIRHAQVQAAPPPHLFTPDPHLLEPQAIGYVVDAVWPNVQGGHVRHQGPDEYRADGVG